MATGPEHYQRAEELLDSVTNENGSLAAMDGDVATILDVAQVHATLALAAATAMDSDQPTEELAGWIEVAGVPRRPVGKPRVVLPSKQARR